MFFWSRYPNAVRFVNGCDGLHTARTSDNNKIAQVFFVDLFSVDGDRVRHRDLENRSGWAAVLFSALVGPVAVF